MRIGMPARIASTTAWLVFLGGALAFAVSSACFWGFSVDDAWIPARFAHHLHQGTGYRFNPGGPVVDAVTPLGFAHLLAPFAATVERALLAAKTLGLVSAALGIGLLARRVWALAGSVRRFGPLLVAVSCLPLLCWSVAGLETGLCIGLGAWAALSRGRGALASGGLLAALRPELVPWVACVALGQAWSRAAGQGREARLRQVLAVVALVLLPSLLVAMVRGAVFGWPFPLAVWAKPSDTIHGLRYAFGALTLTGVPCLLLSPWAWRAQPTRERLLVVAAAIHLTVLIGVGGDWMPLFRLVTPILPGLLYVGCRIALAGNRWATLARVVLALLANTLLLTQLGPSSRRVMEHREALIRRLEPLVLAEDRVVALDVGWVGAAHSGAVYDLAGVTDPQIARLQGGHTSKHIKKHIMRKWRPTVLVLLQGPLAPNVSWWDEPFARQVETRVWRLVQSESGQPAGAELVATLPLPATGQSYRVLRLSSNLFN